MFFIDNDTREPIIFEEDKFDWSFLGEFESESCYTFVLKNNAEHVEEFNEAIKTEVNGLRERGVFEDTRRSQCNEDELRKMLIITAKLLLHVKEPGEPDIGP